MSRWIGPALLALGWNAYAARAAAAEPATAPQSPPVVAPPEDLQHPEQRDRHNSAYTLPSGSWALDARALGISGGDAVAKLGVAWGPGAGFELGLNLAHTSIGLLNFNAAWHFLDTRYVDLGARLGLWYGHGEWFWILEDRAQDLVRNLDVLSIPIGVVASLPVSRRFQFDLTVEYTYSEVFGSITDNDSAYFNAQIGLRQFVLNPGVRLFVSASTELDLAAHLPLYAAIPRERLLGSEEDGSRNEVYNTVPFSEVWSVEVGLRSRFAEGLFGRIALHYGEVTRGLYGAPLYPSFGLEYRL